MTEQSIDTLIRRAVLHYIDTMKQDDIEEYLYVNLMAHYEKCADYHELHEFIKDYTPSNSSYTWFISEMDKANSSGASDV